MEYMKTASELPELAVLHASKLLGMQADGVRLFMAVLAGFPCALAYRYGVSHFAVTVRHLYLFLCGLGLITWNFGTDVKHSLINTAVVYLMIRFIRSPKVYVPLVFTFNVVYLVVAYILLHNTNEYVVNWTMPHCVLCLRLIGLAFDVADGRKYDSLRGDQLETALRSRPSLLETFSYAFFFGGSLVSPQFPCKRYLDFVNGDLIPVQLASYTPNCVLVAFGRFCMSVVCMGVFEVFHQFFYQDYLLSPEFQERNLLVRAVYITLWGYNLLHKYLSVWLMTEGVCTACGLSYSGPTVAEVQSVEQSGPAGLEALVARWKESSHGEQKDWFSACSNVHFRKFEFSASGNDVIGSFNLTTNKWAGRYVFRRLRWLGNRSLSHLGTLFFLALWHGVYTGYFACFFIEFWVVLSERMLGDFVDRHFPKLTPAIENSSSIVRSVIWLFRKFVFQYAASTGLVGFVLLEFRLWFPIYKSMYFTGMLHMALTVVVAVLGFVMPKRRKEKTDKDSNAKAE